MKTARTTTYILIFVLLLVIGALALAACGGSSSTAKQSTGLSSSQAFVASAMVGPREQGAGTTTVVGGVTQVRNGTASYDVEATDSRLAGICDVVYNYDQTADGNATMWGSWKVTNEKGTWVCESWRGAFDSAGHTFTVGLGKGTGAYEGLVSLWQWYWPLTSVSPTTGLPDTSTGLPLMAVSGWIQKA